MRVGTGGDSVVVTCLSDPGGATDMPATDWCALRGLRVGDRFTVDSATAPVVPRRGSAAEAAMP